MRPRCIFSRRLCGEERDRLRLIIQYRKQFREVLLRQGEEEAEQVTQEFRQAKARSEREYEETAVAMAQPHRDRRARAVRSLHRGAMARR